MCAVFQAYLLGSFSVNSRIFSVSKHDDSKYSFTVSSLKVQQSYCSGNADSYKEKCK